MTKIQITLTKELWVLFIWVCLGHWNIRYLNLPFDLAQGGESFDSAQDREPVERLVEPFRISTCPPSLQMPQNTRKLRW